MYLIKYRLTVGPSQHYAPSAMAGATLVREILTGGGSVSSITRTSDGQPLSLADLQNLADTEIGPPDRRRASIVDALLRLTRRRRPQ
ncbi:MAG: hypothetical protein EOP22_06255 [Hyphomicrobiales bacterium]|nr:MAG: hypothetical protein EOP22_06255 [Hyphomicrobiales bacterium]